MRLSVNEDDLLYSPFVERLPLAMMTKPTIICAECDYESAKGSAYYANQTAISKSFVPMN